jgi:hypothetical protein
MITCTVVAPWMSLTHLHSVRAPATLLLLEILLGIMEVIRGAMSLILCPDSYLSFQNKVLVPSPTSDITAMEKNTCRPAFTCIGSEAQCLLSSIFLSHNHSLSAQFRILRSEIPSPQLFWTRHLWPSNQTVSSRCFFSPLPQVTPMNLVNGLVSPRWKVQGHGVIDDCCCHNC